MNVAKLRGIIAERGYSQSAVAQHLGITAKTFYLKMKRGVFGTDEVQRMVSLLEIQNPADIFLREE